MESMYPLNIRKKFMEVIMIAQKKIVCIEHELSPKDLDSVLAQNGFEVIHTPIQENNVSCISRETPDVILIDLSNCPAPFGICITKSGNLPVPAMFRSFSLPLKLKASKICNCFTRPMPLTA